MPMLGIRPTHGNGLRFDRRRRAQAPARHPCRAARCAPGVVAQPRDLGRRDRALRRPGRRPPTAARAAYRVVVARPRLPDRRALRRPPRVQPQRPLLLAGRRAARVRPPAGERLGPRDRGRGGTGADAAARPPAAADQAVLQPRPVRPVGLPRHADLLLGGARRHRLGPAAGGRRHRRRPGERDDLRRADRRRDLAQRGLAGLPPARAHVRDRPHGHRHELEPRPRRRADRLDRAVGAPAPRRAAADRLPRLPRLRLRAQARRAAGVPLRGQPHAVALARDRRGDRGPARPLAGRLPRRARRDHPVDARQAAAAHHARAPATTRR